MSLKVGSLAIELVRVAAEISASDYRRVFFVGRLLTGIEVKSGSQHFFSEVRTRLGLTALVSFFIGFLLFDSSREVAGLRAELAAEKNRKVHSAPKPKEGKKLNFGYLPQVRTNQGGVVIGLSELFTKYGVSERDVNDTREIQRRQQAGEYMLSSESPIMQKFRQNDFRSIAADLLRTNAIRYDQVFGKMGIDPKTSGELQLHLDKIARASLEAEVAEGQLLQARTDYDDRLRGLVSEIDYANYREEERLKPARMAAGEIQQFMAGRNAAFDDPTLNVVTDAISKAGITPSAWHGPYDPLPHVRMGEELFDWSSSQIADLQSLSSRVLEILQQSNGLSPEHLRMVADYFGEKTFQLENRHSQLNDYYSAEKNGAGKTRESP
jgi:hypothetical protein